MKQIYKMKWSKTSGTLLLFSRRINSRVRIYLWTYFKKFEFIKCFVTRIDTDSVVFRNILPHVWTFLVALRSRNQLVRKESKLALSYLKNHRFINDMPQRLPLQLVFCFSFKELKKMQSKLTCSEQLEIDCKNLDEMPSSV